MGEKQEKCSVELRRLSDSTVGKRCCSCPIKSIKNESEKLYKTRIKSDTDASMDLVKTKRKLLVRSREISNVDENDIDSSVVYTIAVNMSPRKRLQYQRSLSLPDVVTSSSPVFIDSSETPDILKKKDRQTFFSESSESMNKASCLKRKKMHIEGPVVFSRSKSVTFENKTDVCLSDQGIHARNLYVRGSSSGYGTGSEQSCSTYSNNSSLSIDMPHSLEQKSDDENDCPKLKGQQIEKACAKMNSTEERLDSSKIPMISLLQQNSNGSICLNLEMTNKLLQYGDIKNPASISDLNTSPLSQFCNEQLELHVEKEMCKKKTQASPRTFTRIPLHKEERFLKNELYNINFESEMLNSDKNQCDFNIPDMITPSPKYNDLKPGCGTDTCTCSRYGIFNYMPTRCSQSYEPQTDDMYGYGTNVHVFEYDGKCVDSIEKACRCTDTRCKDISCNTMKNLLEGLKKVLFEYRTTLDTNHQKILFALRCHSERCDEFKCKMPWCEILGSIEDWSISQAITEIRNRDTLLDSKSSYVECVKISQDCVKRYRHKSIIKEGEDWYSLMPINKKTNLVLAKELQETKGINWIIKKTSLNDYDQQLSVYKKLRECNSPYIVQHHWVIEHGNSSLLICNEFKHSGSLKEILIESKAEYRDIISWMCQVIAGVLHLHKYDIIFLKWASKNILIGDNNCLQICDLSCSVLTTLRQAEYSEVKRSLPLTICPPEMMDESVPNITEKCDSWGCGCLLYELCTTYPVFNELRHDKPEDVWKKIFNTKMPSLPRIFRNYQHILDKCWVSKVNHRESLNDIQSLFIHASRQFQHKRAEY